VSLRCHSVPTASQTAAVEIKVISAEQKWSLFLGCREASFSPSLGQQTLREKLFCVHAKLRMITRKSTSLVGGAVSGNLAGKKRVPRPSQPFSPSSEAGAAGKKARKGASPAARKALLQVPEVQAEEQSGQQEAAGSSTVRVGAASSGTHWESLTVSMRERFVTFVGITEGIIPKDTAAHPGEGKAPKGTGLLLGPWDRQDPDLQDLMSAARKGDRAKLKAALTDHMGRSSVGLNKLLPTQRKEYGAYKVAEAYLALIAEGMEALESVLAEASLGNEAVARFVRDKILGSPAHPAYWTGGAGAELTTHIRVHLLRLLVEREDPAGTWSNMETSVTQTSALSPFGVKEREAARKLALKEAKPSPSQKKSGSASVGSSGKGVKRARVQSSRSQGDGPKEKVCTACGKEGHKAWEGACEPGRKWIAGKKAAGTWREHGQF